MRIPPKLKIGGVVYTVSKNKVASHTAGVYGVTDHYEQTIILDPKAKSDKLGQTMIHEILHAIWDQAGMNSREYSGKQQEEIVDALSNGLYQVMSDNKLIK